MLINIKRTTSGSNHHINSFSNFKNKSNINNLNSKKYPFKQTHCPK